MTPKNDVSCARLNELKAVNDRLVAVMRRKAGFILAELESQAASPPISPYSQTAPVEKSGSYPQTAAATPEQGLCALVGECRQGASPARAAQRAAGKGRACACPQAPLQLRPAPRQPQEKVASLTPPVSDALPPPPSSAEGYSDG